MRVADLVRILEGFDQEYTVNVGFISQYPDTLNAERVLVDQVKGLLVIEADDI